MAAMMKVRSTTMVQSRSIVSLPVRPQRMVMARAQAQQKGGFAKFADSIGMPTDDGIFGFTPFAEMWVGRWAQLGFVSSIVVEFLTGRGTLQQIGLSSPSMPILIALVAVFGTATLVGTGATVQRVTSKKMSRSEMERYRVFLGLNKEDEINEAAMQMKKRGDFTTLGNDEAAIAQARAQTPVDQFLSTNEVAEGQQAAEQMKASVGTLTLTKEQEAAEVQAAEQQMKASTSAAAKREAMARYADTMYFGEAGELAYARDIELTNGRWAMLGFLAAIMVEAATGQGIIGQLITYAKWSGLLGEKSGF